MKKLISKELNESAELKKRISQSKQWVEKINKVAQWIIKAYREGGKVVAFGNGGSAADAEHLISELTGRFLKERTSLPGVALTTNSSTITAISNDYGYEEVFARQVKGQVTKKDIVIGFSTSGESKNVINGLIAGKKIGAKTVGFIGKNGGAMKNKVDLALIIPSQNAPRIQEAHITLVHIICKIIEDKLFP